MLTDILLVGAGYSARAFAAVKPGVKTRIAGTTRAQGNFERLRSRGIEPFLFDGEAISNQLRERASSVQAMVVSASPEDNGDPWLRVAGEDFRSLMPSLRYIAYLSTVGVYGDGGGAWLNETAELQPSSKRGKRRVDAEAAWAKIGEDLDITVAILRLSGIYGPGRNALLNLSDGTARRLVKAGQVFNRIHVADIAGALWHLLAKEAGGVFNVTDDEPAPPQDVVAYAARIGGAEPPPEIPFETADLSPMARSFYAENKRVSNAKLKASGYAFRYPTYRTALDAMYADGSWTGEVIDARSPIRQA